MNEELKPCPFCGGRARFRVSTNKSTHSNVGFDFNIECSECRLEYPKRYECMVCMDEKGAINARTDERPQAINDWNRRVNDENTD